MSPPGYPNVITVLQNILLLATLLLSEMLLQRPPGSILPINLMQARGYSDYLNKGAVVQDRSLMNGWKDNRRFQVNSNSRAIKTFYEITKSINISRLTGRVEYKKSFFLSISHSPGAGSWHDIFTQVVLSVFYTDCT